MSSGSNVKSDEAGDRRMYVNARSSPINVPTNLHVDKNYLQGAQGFPKKSSAADVKTPSPCRGNRAASADTMPLSKQTAAQLKDDIMREIKTELSEPIKDMLSYIIGEIQTLKLKTETVRTCRDISCQTEFLGNLKDKDVSTECSPNSNESLAFSDESNRIGEKEIIQHLSGLGEDENDMSTSATEKPVMSPRIVFRSQRSPAAQIPPEMLNKFQSSSLPRRGKIVQVKPRPQSEVYPARAHSADKRECLANALQFHIEDLVDGLEFHESELLDCLVTEGYLTEDEFESVRKLPDRKDQIRVLLSLIKGRDLNVLERFLKHVKEHNQAVAKKVAEKFESNFRDGIKENPCALCKLERQLNVKHVVDSLWSIQVIDDGIYNEIIHSDAPVGAQSTLWEKIFLSINCLNRTDSEVAHTKLLHAISKNNLLTHLGTQVDEMLRKNGKLVCSCQPKSMSLNRDSFLFPVSGHSSLPDTNSMSFGGTSNSNALVNQGRRENGQASVVKIQQQAIETKEQTKHDSDCSGKNTKPPALPKRRPFAEKLSPEISSDATDSFTSSKASPAASLREALQVWSSQNGSSLNISSKHSAKSKENLEVQISKETVPAPISTKTYKTDLENTDATLGKIPPLPVKKNKYPAWKKVDQHGPSYV